MTRCFSRARFLAVSFAALVCLASAARARQTPSPTQPQTPPAPQNATPLRSTSFLVPIRVVVRDASGTAVANLKPSDFQILQDGKPQQIVMFSESAPDSPVLIPLVNAPAPANASATIPPQPQPPPSLALPSRYVALFFDDVHLEDADIIRSRVAADKFLDASIAPTTRIALYTASGLDQVDFTTDAGALSKAIGALSPHPHDVTRDNALGQCPPMNFYEADLIINHNDKSAQDVAEADALVCTADQSKQAAYVQMMSVAHQLLAIGEAESESTLARLDKIIDRFSKLPAQRDILLVSPGFLTPMAQTRIDEMTERAARAGIFIHTLDARGVFATSPLPDNNNPAAPGYTNPRSAGLASSYRRDGAIAQDDVMRSLAEGTGGYAFLSNNDLEMGFARTVGHSEASYLIAYSPAGLKHDGKFHAIKVSVGGKNDYTIEARRGFFAPQSEVTDQDAPKQQIERAAYSQDILNGVPIDLNLRYALDGSGNAKLSAYAHVNASQAQFDTRDGQRFYNFTVVTALFDSDGDYLEGNQKAVELRLKDPTPERLEQGLMIRSAFDVKQGAHFVRIVVLDTHSGAIAAKSEAIDITSQPTQTADTDTADAAPAAAPANAPTPEPEKKSSKKSATKSKDPLLLWNPPVIDPKTSTKPGAKTEATALNADTACPAGEVIIAAGNRAAELSNNLNRFDALESTAFESLDRYGVIRSFVPASFDYTVEFDREPGVFRIQESRTPAPNSKAGLSAVQDSGVAAIALIFHPFYREDFEMHCDGTSAWNGRPAWIVRFHQIPGRPSRILEFHTPDAKYGAKLKGRAWIAQDSGQILHLETNLEEGIPMANLVAHAISIDYAPVTFTSQRAELWLPQSATSYSEYTDRRVIMHHAYSDFRLFSVQTASAISAPKPAPGAAAPSSVAPPDRP
ncbi:MAG: VWA domain-containing protein [Candidatus Acidiferrales bacterium]